jgi:hypothetical protein
MLAPRLAKATAHRHRRPMSFPYDMLPGPTVSGSSGASGPLPALLEGGRSLRARRRADLTAGSRSAQNGRACGLLRLCVTLWGMALSGTHAQLTSSAGVDRLLPAALDRSGLSPTRLVRPATAGRHGSGARMKRRIYICQTKKAPVTADALIDRSLALHNSIYNLLYDGISTPHFAASLGLAANGTVRAATAAKASITDHSDGLSRARG